MKRSASAQTRRSVREVEPFDPRAVSLTKFKPDVAPKEWRELLAPRPGIVLPPFLHPIEVLSVAKTVGRGRTNITVIVPTIVQADSTTPRATFDRQMIPARNPVIQIHFEPAAYGFTTLGTYIVAFAIEVFGQGTFRVEGNAGTGAVLNGGTKTLSGQAFVSVVLKDMPAAHPAFVFVEQTAGARWNWFSTRISVPPPVLTS